jgi:2-dehydropantoate 2-reductase
MAQRSSSSAGVRRTAASAPALLRYPRLVVLHTCAAAPGSAWGRIGRMRIAVLGPGGVGGLLAALLARRGATVTCLAGESTAAGLARRGISVSSDLFGDFAVPVRAATRLTEPVDACLVAVKATQLDAALERLPADVLGDALVVPFLNGVEHMAVLRARYPASSVVGGTIRVEASRPAPGEVRLDSSFVRAELAPADGLRGRTEPLAAALRDAGVDVDVVADEVAALWSKLVFLAPFALLTTHEAAPLGVVRDRRGDEVAAAVGEAVAVARAEGAPADAEGVLRFIGTLPPGMRSSMQRDAEAGRPLELEAIGGAVLRAAVRHGVDVPVTGRLVADLRKRYS